MNLEKYISSFKPNGANYNSTGEQSAFLQGFNVCLNRVLSVATLLNRKIIGVTGKTGSGKTTYAKTYCSVMATENQKYILLNADEVYHNMLRNDEIRGVKELFGSCILDSDSKINTKLLASIVFNNEEFLDSLNEVVLPQVYDKILWLLSEDRYITDESENCVIVLDAPTLIESGMHNICDSIVFVKTDKETRKQRIMRRDSLTEQQAEARMRFEKPDSYYESFADKIVGGV